MSANDYSHVAALPSFLTWQAGTDLMRSACSLYVRWTYNQLRAWSDSADPDLFNAALSLPRSNQQRLLVAPQSFFLLSSSSRPGIEQLNSMRQFIRAEQYLCDQRVEYPAGSWTALGDYYLPPEKTSVLPAQPRNSWSTDQTFKAPALGHIVVDAYSPYANTDYPAYFGDVSPHSFEEVETIKGRIEESLNLIDSMSRTARLTVGSSAQVISIAKAAGIEKSTGSVSIASRIGRIGLVNLHSDVASVYKITNGIVHESIHSLIYKLELQCSLYTDYAAAHRITTVSPWTGRTLQIHSFVHACFVWFGLLSFWKLTASEEPDVLKLRARARRGFKSGSPLSSLPSEGLEIIEPAVRLAIEEMYDRVVNNF